MSPIHDGGGELGVREPTIHNHSIFAFHDQACATCQTRHAVLDLSQGRFMPCVDCQSKGWRTVRVGRILRWWLDRRTGVTHL